MVFLRVLLAAFINPSPPRWYTSSEWWLVIVATLTAAFIAWQARETAKATQAMRDTVPLQERAANAALLNAQAVINAERAWVVPELHCIACQREDGLWYNRDGVPLSTAEVLAGKHLLYSLKLTNMGRTPAQIIGFQIGYTCLPGIVSDLPPGTEGQLLQNHEFAHLLASGEAIEIFEPVIDVSWYMEEFRDAISKHEKTAVFHGWVKYRHIFSAAEEDCHADFCYVYTVNLNRLSSVGRYTKQR